MNYVTAAFENPLKFTLTGFSFELLKQLKMEDGETVKLHDIFHVDPIELKKFIGCYVDINLVDKVNISGIVYTIDPVSQSVILISDTSESTTMKIIMKQAITSMEINPDTPSYLKNINIDNLFHQKYDIPTNELSLIKERIKSWLLKNMIQVEEVGDILKINLLEIHPPYRVEDCTCSNSIVLDRIQQLLRNMPNNT